jgi:hypothetical protein
MNRVEKCLHQLRIYCERNFGVITDVLMDQCPELPFGKPSSSHEVENAVAEMEKGARTRFTAWLEKRNQATVV